MIAIKMAIKMAIVVDLVLNRLFNPQSGIMDSGAIVRREYVLVVFKSYMSPKIPLYMISFTAYRPIQLNIMEVITSFTLKYALKIPVQFPSAYQSVQLLALLEEAKANGFKA